MRAPPSRQVPPDWMGTHTLTSPVHEAPAGSPEATSGTGSGNRRTWRHRFVAARTRSDFRDARLLSRGVSESTSDRADRPQGEKVREVGKKYYSKKGRRGGASSPPPKPWAGSATGC
jgi:hypothetical protein